jgi:hypothetical protein
MDIREAVTKAFDWAVSIDVDAAKEVVADLRRDYPRASADELAEMVVSTARWKGLAAGLATGLASNPWVAAGAALVDAALVLRTQVEMAGRVALCHDPDHFDREGATAELLVPLLGAGATAELLKSLSDAGVAGFAAGGGTGDGDGSAVAVPGAVGFAGVSRQLIRKSMTGGGAGVIQGLMIRFLLRRLPTRGFLGKAVPILGGLVSGWWNWQDNTQAGKRVRAYFAGKPLPAEPD